MTTSPDGARIHRGRLVVVAVLLTAGFLALGGRLFSIQVLGHAKYVDAARRMHTCSEPLPAYRGSIWSADGTILAADVLDYDLGFDPSLVSVEKLQQIVRLVCDGLGKSAEYRRDRLRVAIAKKDGTEGGGRYLHLADAVSASAVEDIREAIDRICTPEERRGLSTTLRSRRSYPRPDLASAVVGVVDSRHVGVAGIEQSMEPYLSGRSGRRSLRRGATPDLRLFGPASSEVAPVRGYDVVLTIDGRLQALVEAELAAQIRDEQAEAGCFVLMDCNTGDVLALASHPTYDPNRFAEYPAEERKLRRKNRVVEAMVEPGSVMKPYVASYVLEHGIMRRDQLVASLLVPPIRWEGGTRAAFGRRVVSDVSKHDDLTLERAIVYSSNICLGIIGYHLGRDRLVEMLEGFGLCSLTNIRLPAEAPGRYSPAKGWKPLYASVSVAFGYEVMVTPIQLARALAAAVNGGWVLEPRIVKKIRRDGLEEEFPTRRILRRAIGEETSREIRDILRLVVEEGTAKRLRIPGFPFGGKTGTADMARTADRGTGTGYTKTDYLASFEAFAPFESPQVVALCMIERPRSGRTYGGSVAGPVVQRVFRKMFRVPDPAQGPATAAR